MIVRLIVSGKVQGVGYRNSIYQFITDQYLPLNGHVKNLSNGDIEIVIEGDANDIRKVEDFAFVGSKLCKVNHVDKTQLHAAPCELQHFRIEY
jgi:acylphosphatase